MLEALRLINFQIWEEIYLQLVPGINAIIGPSDIGKSSILRAIYWLALNNPSGDEFMKDGAKFCSVEGFFTGGNTVKRFRSAKENKYVINGVDFNTVRTSVPKEAREIMGLTETNFQMQDDPFFLIGLSSAGEVAKKLNQVVGLSLIDTSISHPRKIITRMTAKVKLYKVELKSKKAKLDRFKDLDKVLLLNKKLERLQKEVALSEVAIASLSGRVETLVTLRSAVKRYSAIDDIDEKLDLLSKKKKELEECKSTSEELQFLIKTISQKQKNVKDRQSSIKKLLKLEEKATLLASELNKAEVTISRIKYSIENLNSIQEGIKQNMMLKNNMENKFNKIKMDLEICPICNTVFKENK